MRPREVTEPSELFSHSPFGDNTRSLVLHPASTTHRHSPRSSNHEPGVRGPDVVRLHRSKGRRPALNESRSGR